MSEGPLGRDGHLPDLSIDRHLAADLGDDDAAAVRAHLAACDACRDRVAAAEAIVPQFEALAPPDLSVVAEPANRPFRWASVVAVAAAALVGVGAWVAASPTEDDGIRLKGSGLELEVFVDGTPPRKLLPGDEVVPGDRLGFRAKAAKDGHLVVLGVDETGSVYPCHPSRPAPPTAHAASSEPVDLKAAVVLDAVLGTERMVALHCPDAFEWSAAAKALETWASLDDLPTLRQGCAQDVVSLEKVRVRKAP